MKNGCERGKKADDCWVLLILTLKGDRVANSELGLRLRIGEMGVGGRRLLLEVEQLLGERDRIQRYHPIYQSVKPWLIQVDRREAASLQTP